MKRIILTLAAIFLLLGIIIPGCNGGGDGNGGDGYVPPPPSARFEVISLQVTPEEVSVDSAAIIEASVSNSGNASGIYTANLTVNGDSVKTFEVTISAGETSGLSFSFITNEIGTQTITLNNQTCILEVLPIDIEITVQSPLENERFVIGETVEFNASISDNSSIDGSGLRWISSIDGDLGNGLEIQIDQLSVGTHEIEVTGYGESTSVHVRMFQDLWELYQSPPAQDEIDRILEDFNFVWVNGEGADEQWDIYDPWIFNQESTDPAKIVIIAKLDVLRHQVFSEPLPFTNGLTAYEHLKAYVHTFNLKLNCGYNSAGGGVINLNRNLSVWDGRMSGTPNNPDACKDPFENYSLWSYLGPNFLIIHECRHCESDDPGHTTCEGGVIGDQQLEPVGGYGQAALYSMWIYEYGLYHPEFIKDQARDVAIMLLDRICDELIHSNPLVQALIEELLQ